MENKDKAQGFCFTYSAKEQAELKRIRDKYTAPTECEDKMARLLRLDASVSNTALSVALVFGIIGTLVLGFGMSLVMTDIYAMLQISRATASILGVAVGCFGGALAALAYPIYKSIVKRMKKKLAPEIIRIADELLM